MRNYQGDEPVYCPNREPARPGLPGRRRDCPVCGTTEVFLTRDLKLRKHFWPKDRPYPDDGAGAPVTPPSPSPLPSLRARLAVPKAEAQEVVGG